MNGVPSAVDAHPGPFDFNGDPIWHCKYKDANGNECGQLCVVATSNSEKNAGRQYHKCNVKDPLTNEYHNFRKWKLDLEEKTWSDKPRAPGVPGNQQRPQTVHTQSAQIASSTLMALDDKVAFLVGLATSDADERKRDRASMAELKALVLHMHSSLNQPKPGQAVAQSSLPVTQASLPPYPFPGGSGYANAGMAGAGTQGAPTPGNSPSY